MRQHRCGTTISGGKSKPTNVVCIFQGHMVAKGTYEELQQSGVDFTSLLKEEEEEEQLQQPEVNIRSRTLSENSVLSQTSSVHSVKDGDNLPVSASLLPLFVSQ